MTPEQERKLDEVHEQVMQMHTTLFGVENQEGLLRRVGALERHKEEISGLVAKIFGGMIVLGSIASFIGAKLAALFKIDPK